MDFREFPPWMQIWFVLAACTVVVVGLTENCGSSGK